RPGRSKTTSQPPRPPVRAWSTGRRSMSGDRWVAIVLAAAMAGCADPPCTDCRTSICQEIAGRRNYLAAAPVCERAFAITGDPADGIAAALAYLELHLDDQAFALASRLLGGPRRADALRLMGRVQLGHKKLEAARPLLEEALRLDRDHHDHA